MKTLRHTFVALMLLTAAGCGPMVYDPAYDTTPYAPPSGAVVVTPGSPPVVVDTQVCGVVDGYSVPDVDVELFTDPWCSGAPVVTLPTDDDGRFQASLCLGAGDGVLYAQAVDAWGQTSECSAALTLEGY